MTVWYRVATRVQGFQTSSQLLSFISVYLSWVHRGNAGMYKATYDSCFMAFVLVWCTVICLFWLAHFLDVGYTLYTHGINAKRSRDRVVLFG